MRHESLPREHLMALFRHALETVRADRLAEEALRGKRVTHLIALGKVGVTLAAGALRASGDTFEAGLVLYPEGYATSELHPLAPVETHMGAHPVPNQSSLEAGAALLRFIDALPPSARLAVLISGGASASVEVPASGVTLDVLQRTNRWLLASGLPIEEINRVRAGLSAIKGGGLAHRLQHVHTQAWVLSDIPGGKLASVGGGLFFSLEAPARSSLTDWLAQTLQHVPAMPAADLPLHRLGGNEEAVAAVAEQGVQPWGHLTGDAAELGAEIGQRLVRARPGWYVLGGETTVCLPSNPGRGGRCQHLALAAALKIAGREDCFILSVSTDGWDGTDPVAGACVDGGTVERGTARSLNAREALARATSGHFLEISGDCVCGGPTGTHVNDLVIACKRQPNNESQP